MTAKTTLEERNAIAADFQRSLNEWADKLHKENPDDWFSADETERRVKETMRRCCGQPATFDLETGQNFGEPKLSDDELRKRGYPCALS